MSYKEVVDWLFQQIPNYQSQGGSAYKPGFDRILQLLDLLDNPHNKLKTIHIAGTNGKGSVSHITAAIFQENGYKTGLFNSPHIKDFNERIKIDGQPISHDYIVEFVSLHQDQLIEIQPSFFEITAAMAFKVFVDMGCDIAIIETGLGGRLDATNVIQPELAIITNIGMDHIAFLGDTLELIATEKAGIIKKGVPVAIGDCDPKLRQLFKNVALEKQSNIVFSLDWEKQFYLTDLLGEFQQRNIHTVITSLCLLSDEWELDSQKIIDAIKNVKALTNFHGRLQQISEYPKIIVDAAHNVEGIANLLEEVSKFKYKDLRIVYGASNDKDWQKIIENFPLEAIYYFTAFDSKRSVTKSEFNEVANKTKLIYNTFEDAVTALNTCKSDAQSDDLILVCGSFYLMEKII
ncbi:bifunctional folylpolyglutamate synthase/dihydrofolate synthase [Crocinitomix sp.]|nr:bifunctional folylpolyglutamate synthase/dihydrofolate synthase [Crocinitomix sp.]